jgi:hypothetical protein
MVILRSGRDTLDQSVEICSICLEDINSKVSWSLNCHHCFHKECLRNHFLASLRQYDDNFVPECPNCRNPICDETIYDSETSIDLDSDEPEQIPKVLEYLHSIGFDNWDAREHYSQWESNVFDKIQIICTLNIIVLVELPIITEEELSDLLSFNMCTMQIFALGKAEFPKFSSNEVELVRKIIGYSLRQSKFGIPLPEFLNDRMKQTILSATYVSSKQRPLSIQSIVRIDNGMTISLSYANDGTSSSSNCTFVLSNGPNIFTIEKELTCESDQPNIINTSFDLLQSDNGAIVNGASFVIDCFIRNDRGDYVYSNVMCAPSNLTECALEFSNNSYSQS